MTQDDDKQDRRLGLSTAQVTGSALAAMSGALVASMAGTTGTVIGAAVGSVIATVGATMYTESLRRTGSAAKKTAAVVRQRGALITGALPRTAVDEQPRHRDDPVASARADQPREGGENDENTSRERRWDLPWGKVAIASLAVMVAGLAGITAVEAVTGEPVSSLMGGDNGQGTTVGHVVGDDTSTKEDPTPNEDTPATHEPEPSSEPSEEPEAPAPSTTPDPTTELTESPGTLSEGETPAP